MRGLSQLSAVVAKDLLLEWRGRSRLFSVLLFGVVTLLLFSFAVGPDGTGLEDNAPGFLVLALLLSSTLALSESFRLEQEERAIEGLLLLPIDPVALYYGKALGNTLFLFGLGPFLVPTALALYGVPFDAAMVFRVLLLWGLAAAGLSAPGTLYAAMTSRLTSRDVLLPILLFPLLVPVLVAAVKSIALVLAGDPMDQIGDWTLLLVAFDVVYWALCGVLFPQAIEDV